MASITFLKGCDKEDEVVRQISNCTVKPRCILQESQQPCYLTPWDLLFLSTNYIQNGLLFTKPQHIDVPAVLDRLKDALATTLTYFYPLAGRLVTKKTQDPASYCVFLDCADAPGAQFVHASADVTISDILSPVYVPEIVQSLFALDQPISHDGHTSPLLAVQVTELVDGMFIACSFNHVVGDGSSFWHFFNTWSQLSRSTEQHIIRPPAPYRERVFHFTSESVAQLKATANADLSTNTISSFQALAAHVWRSVTRARGLLPDQNVYCVFGIDSRLKMEVPLSSEYFGNFALVVFVTTTVGKLLSNNLGWSSWLLHQEIADHNKHKVRLILEALSKVPSVYKSEPDGVPCSILFGMSPRFDVYSNDFGWGEPIAVRSGYGLKFDGKVTWYPGREGGGSVDAEICLVPESMSALELDDEFMKQVSPSPAFHTN